MDDISYGLSAVIHITQVIVDPRSTDVTVPICILPFNAIIFDIFVGRILESIFRALRNAITFSFLRLMCRLDGERIGYDGA